tara:strand:+ start:4226 stop:6433 length:2208 start_codon:yes stop_codon:yes gene_type:complete
MKKTYRKKPTKRYDLGGDIGAGFAGAAKGVVGTVLPGPLGSMAMQGVDAIHGAIDKDITDQELAIRGYGQAAGAAGAAIVSGGSLTGQAIGVGAQGLGQGISNTNSDDPNMQMIGQGINLAGQIGGMAYGNAQDKKLAMGGKMQQGTNGGQEQLNQFNGGGTHEENPMGGIPVGNGQSVEAGETEFTPENYVFSDRLKSNKVLAKEFGFKNSNKTFAELSKAIDKKYSTRNSDSMDEESKTRELGRLMEAQEAVKEEKMQKDLAKFEKEQPELFAQMQAQAQQAAQGQGQPQQEQPQQQMPEGGMPQGMGQAGQMAMGGYRMTDNKQYDEGGDLGKLYQMYRKGIITQEELNSYREDLDMGVNFQTVFGQINYNQSQNDSESTPFTTKAQAEVRDESGNVVQQAAPGSNPIAQPTQQVDPARAAQQADFARRMGVPQDLSAVQEDSETTPFTVATPEQAGTANNAAASNTEVAPENSLNIASITGVDSAPQYGGGASGLSSKADGTFTDTFAGSAYDEDPMVTPEEAAAQGQQDPAGFKPGLANQVGQFAPIAYNLYQGLKKEDTLDAGDYMTDQKIDPATMNVDPMLRKNTGTFQGTMNTVRSGAGGSGGSYLANLQQAQLNKYAGDANVLNTKSNYDQQQRVAADQANIRLDQQNNQIRRGVDDFNLRSKATKENALGDAANNIASMTTANMQTKANAYGYSKMAPMYEYMFNNYTKNNTKSNTTDNKNETTT